MILFDLTSLDTKPLEVPDIDKVLKELEIEARKQIGRRVDLLVKDSEALYVAMPSTVKQEAARVVERIAKACRQHLRSESLDEKMALRYRIIGFPEDGANEPAFLKSIFESEVEG